MGAGAFMFLLVDFGKTKDGKRWLLLSMTFVGLSHRVLKLAWCNRHFLIDCLLRMQ